MKTTNIVLWLSCMAVAAAAARGEEKRAGEQTPPVFSSQSYEDALAATRESDRILLVKATAVWCLPCKQMDRTTWRDESVVRWIEKHALAIQIDVDQQQELSVRLKVSAMPTIIALKRGVEFDRIIGYRDAEALLKWLESVREGRREVDALREKVKSAGDGDVDVRARLNYARTLLRRNEFDSATKEYVWLWENMVRHEPHTHAVRGSFVAADMHTLASRHAAARERFVAIRDAIEAAFESDGEDRDRRNDWLVLNRVVGDEDRTLRWFDRMKEIPRGSAVLARHSLEIERLLESRGRVADLIQLYPDPGGELRIAYEAFVEVPARYGAGGGDQTRGELQRAFRNKAGRLYAALLGAGRDPDARELAAEALRLDESHAMRVALVDGALRVERPLPEHLEWLHPIAESDENAARTQAALRKALERRPGGP